MAGSGAHGAAVEGGDLSCAGLVHQNVFYFEGRHRRRIYEDLELHALMLTLMLALLMTPRRGLLDSRYCEQYPLMNHKRNIPFLLSVHLNHSANRAVLPWIFQQVETITHIGVFRLLKLLCESAMHRWMYTSWSRIAGGTFGTVYRCTAQLSETGTVAVKQIPKQTNIQDRCVFFDVFNEIACLDAIRFEDNVCHLFDYGVDESGYWIVMKYYSNTLKKWRESLQGSMSKHLPVLIAVFKQVLKAVHTLHRFGVVHYDLKCDNVMIELDRPAQGGYKSEDSSPLEHGSLPGDDLALAPRVALADFGESRMLAAADELDLRNRGTEIVKCPEMLELEKVGKKEGNSYDRRKRIGTNQAADIWSLGCLLFELLTGRFLFQDDDFGMFWARVTGRMAGSDDGDVVSEANTRLLEGCAPLIEFIRYMLVRDPQRRPTIAAAVKRFDAAAAEALRWLKGEGTKVDELAEGPETPSSRSMHHRDSLAASDSPRSVACSVGGSSDGRSRAKEDARPERPLVCAVAGEAESYFTRVLGDLCILEASEQDLLAGLGGGAASSAGPGPGGANAWGALRARLAQRAWTHVVDFRVPGSARLPCQLDVPFSLSLPWSSPARSAEEFLRHLPSIFDFLRHAAITRGVVLFVDGHSKDADGDAASGAAGAGAGAGTVAPAVSRGGGGLAVAAVLALVAETYRMAIYAALSFLSSQLLVAALRPDAATALAKWQESERHTAWAQCEGTVRIACLCGSCSWHVPVAWLVDSASRPQEPPEAEPGGGGPPWLALGSGTHLVSCQCTVEAPASFCPNRGNCESYTRWLHARFGVSIPSVKWLWLPEGVCAAECSDGPGNGVLTQGIASQAEPVGGRQRQDGAVRLQRFRCRSCQVLTHAEVQAPAAAGGAARHNGLRVALVCSHELLRSARLRLGTIVASYAAVGPSTSGGMGEVGDGGIYPGGADGRSLAVAGRAGVAGARRPPEWLHSACLEEVVLPRVQPGIEDLL